MQRTGSSSIKQIREKSETNNNSSLIYGMPPPTNNNTTQRLAQIDDMKYFFATATQQWNHDKALKRFDLIGGESISCVLWEGVFFITGTDIVRSLTFRFHAFGRPVTNLKKFEEGIFSDLRNLKPGQDARLENPKSDLLEMLYKNNCIRTQKKQKVFFWFSVPHDRLFLDALERDLKREKMGFEPTTKAVAQPAISFTLETAQNLFEQFKKSKSKSIPQTDHSPTPSTSKQKRPRVNSVPSVIGQKQQLQLLQQKRQSHGSYFSSRPLPSLTTGRIQHNTMYDNTVSLSDISKSSPLCTSDFTDLSNGVHQLDITSSLSSGILQHNPVPPSRSVDNNKTHYSHLGLYDGSLYKAQRNRRRATSVSTSLLQQYSAPNAIRRPYEKCTNPLRQSSIFSGTTNNGLMVDSQSSRLAMAAAKAGFAAANPLSSPQDYYCPVPECRHLFKRSEHLERHIQSLHPFLYQQKEDETTSRCSTLSPMLDVDFDMPEVNKAKDDISSSSGSSPRSVFRYDTMKLLDSFKPNEEETEQEQPQPEYGLQPMNDISFDQSHVDANMLNEPYQSIYAPFIDQQYVTTPYNYMM